MIVDKRNEFCDATALNTGGAGTYLIGNQIDLSVARDIGNRSQLYLVIVVTTAFVSGGGGSVRFILASDASASIQTDGSASEHVSTSTFTAAEGTAGTVLAAIPLPLEGIAYERYLGVLQVVTTAAFSAGAVDAFITDNPPAWKAYPEGAN